MTVDPNKLGFLAETDIRALLQGTPPLASGKPDVDRMSLNLTIGGIFVPGTEDGKLGGPDKPYTKLSLKQGETAVIRTDEKLTMPGNVGAIGFPPARLSLQGLLTTNPGHVDPGYDGHLHLTVINMSHDTLELSKGQKIMRLLLFRGDELFKPLVIGPQIDEQLLDRLSRDFLDIKARAQNAATNAVTLQQVWVPIITAIITAGVALGVAYFSYVNGQNAELQKIQSQISNFEGELSPKDNPQYATRMKAVEAQLKATNEKLNILAEQKQQNQKQSPP